MRLSLSDWHKNGWLKNHAATHQEISELLALAARDLRNAGAKGLDDDWRFNIAYNAVLQAASAAFSASGYAVPKGVSHHFRAIGSLKFTLALDDNVIDKLDRYRKRRSMAIYDVAGVITAAEAKDIQSVAKKILADVRSGLAQVHPELNRHLK
jgi:hypothetical protein